MPSRLTAYCWRGVNDRRARRRRLEVARTARVLVEALGGRHQRLSAISEINRSSERGLLAGLVFAACARVSGLPGIGFSAAGVAAGAASADAMRWRLATADFAAAAT